ncbi:Uncharacterised protein [Proteus vulgaris]|nr:hypothetical protein BN1805_00273 [Proteus vulgaris]SUC00925.1 Uncharacterised protein [Proteus vulgaris]
MIMMDGGYHNMTSVSFFLSVVSPRLLLYKNGF